MKRFLSLVGVLVLVSACSSINEQSASEKGYDDNVHEREEVVVQNFEECVEETGVVMESFPRQCAYNGEAFVEEIDKISALNENFQDMTPFLQGALQVHLDTQESVIVELESVHDEHVRGMFRVGDEQAGALFLAVWKMGEWEIAYAGNGVISCDELAEYGFPVEMIQDCN